MEASNLDDALYWYKAKVYRVIDGDTIEVEVDHGMNIYSRQHLRLKDVNAPEMSGVKKDSEEYKKGLVVKERLTELLSKDPYVLIRTFKDQRTFNRYVADVFVKTPDDFWKSVCVTLLEEGLVTKV